MEWEVIIVSGYVLPRALDSAEFKVRELSKLYAQNLRGEARKKMSRKF